MIKSGHKTGGGISSIRIKHNLYDILSVCIKESKVHSTKRPINVINNFFNHIISSKLAFILLSFHNSLILIKNKYLF
jgi:hypothetical protein